MVESKPQWDQWNEQTDSPGLLHRDRFPLMRTVQYERSRTLEEQWPAEHGHGLMLNVSNGGICLLIEGAPALQDVLKVHVPMPISHAKTPTLAEVRWVRPLPFKHNGIYVVGLKFLL